LGTVGAHLHFGRRVSRIPRIHINDGPLTDVYRGTIVIARTKDRFRDAYATSDAQFNRATDSTTVNEVTK